MASSLTSTNSLAFLPDQWYGWMTSLSQWRDAPTLSSPDQICGRNSQNHASPWIPPQLRPQQDGGPNHISTAQIGRAHPQNLRPAEEPDTTAQDRWSTYTRSHLGNSMLQAAFQTACTSRQLAWEAAGSLLLEDTSHWMSMVRMDWISTLDPTFLSSECATCDHAQTTEWFLANQKSGPKRIKQLAWKHRLQESTVKNVHDKHEKCHEAFVHHGYSFMSTLDGNKDSRQEACFHCGTCQNAFTTIQ